MSPADFAESTLPLRLARELGLAYGMERSFKMIQGALLPDRYLLGIDKREFDARRLQRLLDGLDFPARYRERFLAALPEANLLLLGFERGPRQDLLKVYLEYWDLIKAAARRDPQDRRPRLMFLGFKWNPGDPAAGGITRYDCFPRLGVEEILERVAALVPPRTAMPMLAIESLVRRAAQGGAGAAFKYLEASEEGNERRSFDLNLYSADLRLRDIQSLLASLAGHYRIDPADLARRRASSDSGILGHISGGVGRLGEAFFSVYYEPA